MIEPPCLHRPRVLYLSHATDDVYALIHEAGDADFEIVTLDHDDDAERIAKIANCEAVICAATPLRKIHLDAGNRLRVVHHQGVGWQDTTDWQDIKQRGLPLALTPEGTTIGVAEHTILMMLAASKRLPFADAELRRGKWHVNALRAVSRELYGKSIGYVGFGRIGQAGGRRAIEGIWLLWYLQRSGHNAWRRCGEKSRSSQSRTSTMSWRQVMSSPFTFR